MVSHSAKIAEGVAELLLAVTGGDAEVRAAGGGEDGSLGTSPGRVLSAIERVLAKAEVVLVFADLGSSVMCVEALLDQEPGLKERVRLVDAPMVEGAVAAAVAAYVGEDADRCVLAAHEG